LLELELTKCHDRFSQKKHLLPLYVASFLGLQCFLKKKRIVLLPFGCAHFRKKNWTWINSCKCIFNV